MDQDLTPASAAIQAEMQRCLHEAITQLDDDDRVVILMRHYEMLANQEVAAALELTEAAASMRYLRAVRKLRDLLTPLIRRYRATIGIGRVGRLQREIAIGIKLRNSILKGSFCQPRPEAWER